MQAADGRVFVLNANDRRIAVYDSVGTWIDDVGAIGNGPGEFTSPMDIAVTRDHIYILDGERFSLLQTDRDRHSSAIRICAHRP